MRPGPSTYARRERRSRKQAVLATGTAKTGLNPRKTDPNQIVQTKDEVEMIDYLNPADLGDFSPQGLSSGTATDVFVYAAGLAIDPETMARRKERNRSPTRPGSASRTSPGSWRTQASHCETSSRPPATCRTRHIASTSSMHTRALSVRDHTRHGRRSSSVSPRTCVFRSKPSRYVPTQPESVTNADGRTTFIGVDRNLAEGLGNDRIR